MRNNGLLWIGIFGVIITFLSTCTSLKHHRPELATEHLYLGGNWQKQMIRYCDCDLKNELKQPGQLRRTKTLYHVDGFGMYSHCPDDTSKPCIIEFADEGSDNFLTTCTDTAILHRQLDFFLKYRAYQKVYNPVPYQKADSVLLRNKKKLAK
jgi:hypothetical protein